MCVAQFSRTLLLDGVRGPISELEELLNFSPLVAVLLWFGLPVRQLTERVSRVSDDIKNQIQ